MIEPKKLDIWRLGRLTITAEDNGLSPGEGEELIAHIRYQSDRIIELNDFAGDCQEDADYWKGVAENLQEEIDNLKDDLESQYTYTQELEIELSNLEG